MYSSIFELQLWKMNSEFKSDPQLQYTGLGGSKKVGAVSSIKVFINPAAACASMEPHPAKLDVAHTKRARDDNDSDGVNDEQRNRSESSRDEDVSRYVRTAAAAAAPTTLTALQWSINGVLLPGASAASGTPEVIAGFLQGSERVHLRGASKAARDSIARGWPLESEPERTEVVTIDATNGEALEQLMTFWPRLYTLRRLRLRWCPPESAETSSSASTGSSAITSSSSATSCSSSPTCSSHDVLAGLSG